MKYKTFPLSIKYESFTAVRERYGINGWLLRHAILKKLKLSKPVPDSVFIDTFQMLLDNGKDIEKPWPYLMHSLKNAICRYFAEEEQRQHREIKESERVILPGPEAVSSILDGLLKKMGGQK